MYKTEPNDPISPIEHTETYNPGSKYPNVHTTKYLGLSKREQFAAMAMQGLCANSNSEVCDKTTVNGGWHHPETIATLSVQMADALIKALNESEAKDA